MYRGTREHARAVVVSGSRVQRAPVDDEAVESGSDPVGVLFARGPPVAKALNVEGLEGSYVDIGSKSDEDDGWVGLGVRAKMQSNGAMIEIVNS